MGLKVFVDFDGTITVNDVGNSFFRRFGGCECDLLVQRYRSGELTAVECFRREAEAVGVVDRQEADAFVRGQEIDPTFRDFALFCKSRGMELTILSDGLDYYVQEILRKHSLDDIPAFANHAEFVEHGAGGRARLELRFPYTDAECTRCACCKRNLMLTHAGEEDVIAFVGEGFSDACPAQYADIVFAKDELQQFCQTANISYYLYSSFADVQGRLAELLDSPRGLRRRRQAELKRREAFISE